jgi:quinoprotein glucose dehydrogenase
LYAETQEPEVKKGILSALNRLKYSKIQSIIKSGMEDENENVRTAALGLLDDTNVSKEDLPSISNAIFAKGGLREQQQFLVVLSKLKPDKTFSLLESLVGQMRDKKLSPDLNLELKEAVEACGNENLKTQWAALKPQNSVLADYMETLYGGSIDEGRNLFFYNSTAQCARCHAVGKNGGTVGPALTNVGKALTREQILQSIVDPSFRIAPGYGNVSVVLKDGQQAFGVLTKETDEALTLATSHAEPLVIPLARVSKRENLPSSMPAMGEVLSKRELRDLVEYLASLGQ